METIINLSNKRLRNISLNFRRYLLDEIDWSDRLITIMGCRGAGKTTLMLQHLKTTFGVGTKAIYTSLDNIYFTKNSLVDLVEEFVNRGGVAIYIDEVHKYPNWSVELKNIYDDYPELKVVFSGSSMLEIFKGKGDLSRRLSSYTLSELSFREYIEFEHKIKLTPVGLDDILCRHEEICNSINDKLRPLPTFYTYLKIGAFPFFKESKSKYNERLHNTVNMILDYDLPSITTIDYAHVLKIKLLLKIISDAVPFKPNISKLASQTGIDRKTVMKYLDILDRAGLVKMLTTPKISDSAFTKPEKIYLGNTNYMYALCDENPNIGTLRETFFCNQLSVMHKVNYSDKSDFLVNKKLTFEIGGKKKKYKQIADMDNSYIASDDIEYGYGNRIPLWLFGFMW